MSTTDARRPIDPRAARERAKHAGELLRLSDERTYFADEKEDIRGRKLIDAMGQEMGIVDRLLLDNEKHHVRLLQVRTRTGFLGLHRHTATVPVDAIVRMEADCLYLSKPRATIEVGPKIADDSKLIDEQSLRTLYAYYKVTPWWEAQYVACLFHSHHHTTRHLHHHTHGGL